MVMVLTRRAAERAEDPHTGVPSLRVPASPRETFIPQTLTYDNHLQIADNNGNGYVWDPTEPIATRSLVWMHGGSAYSYTHDGNKNVSEVVDANGAVTAHYEYAPFGDVTVSVGSLASANRFRFSSEYADDTLGLVYYNYRHYEPVTGRWMGRDTIEEFGGINVYAMIKNFPITNVDYLGFKNVCECIEIFVSPVYRCNWNDLFYAQYYYPETHDGDQVPYYKYHVGLFGLKHRDRIMWVSVEVVPISNRTEEMCHCDDIYYGKANGRYPYVEIQSINGLTKSSVWNIVFNMEGKSTYDRYITQYVPEYESPFESPYAVRVRIEDQICEEMTFTISY